MKLRIKCWSHALRDRRRLVRMARIINVCNWLVNETSKVWQWSLTIQNSNSDQERQALSALDLVTCWVNVDLRPAEFKIFPTSESVQDSNLTSRPKLLFKVGRARKRKKSLIIALEADVLEKTRKDFGVKTFGNCTLIFLYAKASFGKHLNMTRKISKKSTNVVLLFDPWNWYLNKPQELKYNQLLHLNWYFRMFQFS